MSTYLVGGFHSLKSFKSPDVATSGNAETDQLLGVRMKKYKAPN